MADVDPTQRSYLTETAEHAYRDAVHRLGVDGSDIDQRTLAIDVAERTARSALGLLLMELRRRNEIIDSLQLERLVDQHARYAGLTNVTSNSYSG